MISILVPIYNDSILELAAQLSLQASRLEENIEIFFLDDCSEESWLEINRAVGSMPYCRYEELPANVGRSRIRNLLAARARYQLYLFLDGDTQIIRDDFLSTYLKHLGPEKVLVGGRDFPTYFDKKSQKLHWLSGYFREKKSQSGFQSNNFLISKALYDLVGGFDKSLDGYGHEDTLFGWALARKGIKIQRINNPTLQPKLKEAVLFVSEQEEALRNLHRIATNYPELETNLLKISNRLETWRLSWLIRKIFRLSGKQLRHLLIGPLPTLFLLDLYKIGYYLSLESDSSDLKR